MSRRTRRLGKIFHGGRRGKGLELEVRVSEDVFRGEGRGMLGEEVLGSRVKGSSSAALSRSTSSTTSCK